MSISMFDLNKELENIKKSVNKNSLGMILVHNGIVRGSPKENGGRVVSLNLKFDEKRLKEIVDAAYKSNSGIKKIVVWINEGVLNVGDDMMYVIVAGDRRINILKPFEDLIESIKKDVVEEKELIDERHKI